MGKNQEPDPLEKKSGAGAAKKLAGSPALLEIDQLASRFFFDKQRYPRPSTFCRALILARRPFRG